MHPERVVLFLLRGLMLEEPQHLRTEQGRFFLDSAISALLRRAAEEDATYFLERLEPTLPQHTRKNPDIAAFATQTYYADYLEKYHKLFVEDASDKWLAQRLAIHWAPTSNTLNTLETKIRATLGGEGPTQELTNKLFTLREVQRKGVLFDAAAEGLPLHDEWLPVVQLLCEKLKNGERRFDPETEPLLALLAANKKLSMPEGQPTPTLHVLHCVLETQVAQYTPNLAGMWEGSQASGCQEFLPYLQKRAELSLIGQMLDVDLLSGEDWEKLEELRSKNGVRVMEPALKEALGDRGLRALQQEIRERLPMLGLDNRPHLPESRYTALREALQEMKETPSQKAGIDTHQQAVLFAQDWAEMHAPWAYRAFRENYPDAKASRESMHMLCLLAALVHVHPTYKQQDYALTFSQLLRDAFDSQDDFELAKGAVNQSERKDFLPAIVSDNYGALADYLKTISRLLLDGVHELDREEPLRKSSEEFANTQRLLRHFPEQATWLPIALSLHMSDFTLLAKAFAQDPRHAEKLHALFPEFANEELQSLRDTLIVELLSSAFLRDCYATSEQGKKWLNNIEGNIEQTTEELIKEADPGLCDARTISAACMAVEDYFREHSQSRKR